MIKLTSTGVKNGIIDNRFGKHGEEKIGGVPIRSIPLGWEDLPEKTKSLALVMQDYDAFPVCGFSWIHWLVANIDPTPGGLAENASRGDTTLIQGKNSLSSKQICGDLSEEVTHYYSGPRPPDKDHEYEIKIYALDTTLDLRPGFGINELVAKMRDHILDEGILLGKYPCDK